MTDLYKICTKCKAVLLANSDNFGPHRSGKFGLNPRCRNCCRDDYRTWLESNKERARECFKKYREANREAIREKARRYYWEHRKEQIQRVKKWREKHPEQHRSINRNYKSRKKGSDGIHSANDVREQLSRQSGKCFYCGESVGTQYHVDHFIPLSKGGSNGPENIVVACPRCNMAKHSKDPYEFMAAIGGK